MSTAPGQRGESAARPADLSLRLDVTVQPPAENGSPIPTLDLYFRSSDDSALVKTPKVDTPAFEPEGISAYHRPRTAGKSTERVLSIDSNTVVGLQRSSVVYQNRTMSQYGGDPKGSSTSETRSRTMSPYPRQFSELSDRNAEPLSRRAANVVTLPPRPSAMPEEVMTCSSRPLAPSNSESGLTPRSMTTPYPSSLQHHNAHSSSRSRSRAPSRTRNDADDGHSNTSSEDERSVHSSHSTRSYAYGSAAAQKRRTTWFGVGGWSARTQDLIEREVARRKASSGSRREVTARGVRFEIVDPQGSSFDATLPGRGIPPVPPVPSQQRSASGLSEAPRGRCRQARPRIFIPPSQEPAASFTVHSCERSPSPSPSASPFAHPSFSRHSSRSPGSRQESLYGSPSDPGYRCHSQSRSRSGSRSPSPARGAYNPYASSRASAIDRCREAVDEILHLNAMKAGWRPLPSFRIGSVKKKSQEDIASWQCPTLKDPLSATVESGTTHPANASCADTSSSITQAREGGKNAGTGYGSRVFQAYDPTAHLDNAAATSTTTVKARESDELFFTSSPSEEENEPASMFGLLWAGHSSKSSASPSWAEPRPSEMRVDTNADDKVQMIALGRAVMASSLNEHVGNQGQDQAEPFPHVLTTNESGVQRTDSLFLPRSPSNATTTHHRHIPEQQSFFAPPWTQQHVSLSWAVRMDGRSRLSREQIEVAVLPSNYDGGVLQSGTDARRGLPSQVRGESGRQLSGDRLVDSPPPSTPISEKLLPGGRSLKRKAKFGVVRG